MTVEAYQPKCNYINTAFNTANVNLDLSNEPKNLLPINPVEPVIRILVINY